MKQGLKTGALVLIVLGVAVHAYAALRFQTRAWIDEIWVVLNPAFRLLHGHTVPGHAFWSSGGWGTPNEDLREAWIRSWIPPGLIALYMKTLAVFSIERGTVVLPLVRLLMTLANVAGMVAFSHALARRLRLMYAPVLPLLVLLFMPEVVHYSVTADLSVFAMPFLLFGLSSQLLERHGLAAVFLSFAALIRFQYGVFPAVVLVWFLGRREWRHALELAAVGIGALAFELALNSWAGGHFVLPIWNYFYANTIGGMAAQYGTTPFYFGFELLWRFTTEPVFALIIFTFVAALARLPLVSAASWLFFLVHLAVPHKEYRFFYGSAVLLSGIAASVLQSWIEEAPTRARLGWGLAFVGAFVGVASFRAVKKTAWGEFEIPARMETIAGTLTDMHGLIVYGWSGIHTGGVYTFHRDLPYVFAPKSSAVGPLSRQRGYSPGDFNYVLTRADLPAPCRERTRSEPEAALYHCSDAEVARLFEAR